MTTPKFLASDDLLTEVLLRLPSSSVARFRSVSKRWLSIITNPNFRHLHHSILHPPPSAIFLFRHLHRYTYLDLISLSPHPHHRSPKLDIILDDLSEFHTHGFEILNIHSCKGLMCIHSYNNGNSECRFFGANNRIYVYNPWTSKSRLIPKVNTKEKLYNVVGVYVVFEHLCDDYKIVCAWERVIENDDVLNYGVRNDIVMFSFYSSKKGDWSERRAVLVVRRGEIEFRGGVVWKGNVHLFGWRPKLVCLDVGKECFRTMPEPGDFRTMKFWCFGESGGKLYLVGNRNGVALDVMVLEDYNDEWVVKHRIDLSWFLGTKWFRDGVGNGHEHRSDQLKRYFLMGFNVLCFVVNCVDGTEKLLISVGDKLLLYDIHGMEIEEIAEINPLKSSMVKQDIFEFKWFEAYQLIRTQVSL